MITKTQSLQMLIDAQRVALWLFDAGFPSDLVASADAVVDAIKAEREEMGYE